VTNIGQAAFAGCTGLTNVMIGNGVTALEVDVFRDCSNLTSVTIPDGVSWIGFWAFDNCKKLATVTIPDSVTCIAQAAFAYTALTNVTIGNNVTVLGPYAFYLCTNLAHVTIGNGVTNIMKGAFEYCRNLTNVTIPDSVTILENGAFHGCGGLTNVTIQGNVTNDWYYRYSNSWNDELPPFYWCTNLETVVLGDKMTKIGSYMFYNCPSLTSVTIGNGVTNIGTCAFSGCSGLAAVNIHDLAGWCRKSLGSSIPSPYSLFLDGEEVTDLTIPGNVSGIGNRAFSGCTGLTSVTIPDCVTNIGSSAFSNCVGLASVTIGNGVTDIGSYAFSRCRGLTNVVIPDSVTSIGGSAFSYCSGLTSVTISDSVTSIGGSAFSYCSGLTSVTIPDSVTRSLYAFSGCSNLMSVTIGKGVTDLGGFSGCTSLTKVTIGNNVTSIGNSAFSGCSSLTSVTIPDKVTSIGKSAFSGCAGLTSVTIGNNVTSIGNGAFSGCSGLTAVNIHDLAGWCRKSLGSFIPSPYSLFLNGKEVTDLTIPGNVTNIGSSAFSGCIGLTSVTIPGNVSSLGSSAFSNCVGLTSVTLGNGVTSIGSHAFSGCGRLTSVTIPDNVNSLGSSAFSGCAGLTSLTIGNGVTSIGYDAFSGCTGLTSVTIPDNVTSLGSSAFSGCAGLTSLTIGNGVTNIGSTAFSGCTGLTSVTIPDNVRSLGSSAFSGCAGLTSLTIGNGVTSIGKNVFADTALSELVVPETWEGTAMLESAGVSEGCEVVYGGYSEMDAQGYCSVSKGGHTWTFQVGGGKAVLTTVRLGHGCVSVPVQIYVKGIGKVPVVRIADSAFAACGNLTAVVLPDNLETVATGAFSGCASLKRILAPTAWEGTAKMNGVRLPAGCEIAYCSHSGRLAASQVWAAGTVHVLDGKLTVPSGVTLAIEPGAVVKFLDGTRLTVASGGACVANGAIFTHIADDTAGGDTLLDGDATQPVAGRYTLTGTITENDATEERYTAPVQLSGTISSSTRWRGHKVYHVTGNLTVSSSRTLTIDPAAVVKFASGCSLIVKGTLNAKGTRAEPIVFTSVKDDEHGGDNNWDGDKTYPQPGDWYQIRVSGTAAFDHCSVLYASSAENYGGVEAYGGTVTFDNGEIAHMKYDSVNAHSSGSFTARNTAIWDGSLGLGYYGSGKVKLYNCVFQGLTTAVRQSGKLLINCVLSDCNAFTDQSGDGSTFDHCVFWNPAGFGAQSYTKVGSSGNVWGDPLFVDAENGDFRLLSAASPCVDAADTTQAPATDAFGSPRMDVKVVKDTGIPDADGVCADIGIHELPGNTTLPAPDIVPVSLSLGKTALDAGDSLPLSWMAASVGLAPFSGSWRDRIVLVDESGSRSVDLGTVVSSGAMAPGTTNAFSAGVRLPAEAEGTWRVALHLNSARDVWEGSNGTNNSIVSASTLTVSIPATAPAAGVSGTASAGAPGFAKIAAGGEALLVRVSAPAGTVVYLGSDYLPSASGYTARAVAGADGTAVLAVPAGTDAAYLLVESATGASVAFSASFESGSLAVTRVSSPTLPYSGTATLGVTGAAFESGCTAALVRGGTVAADAVAKTAVLSTTTLALSLDCGKLAQGASYDLRVTAADGRTATLRNAVTVATVPPKAVLKASLDVPATVRRGRTVTVWVDYENTGNIEMPAPVFEIVSQGQVFQVGGAVYTNSVKVMGLSKEAPVGALRPGEKQRLGVKATLLANDIKWKLLSHHALQDVAKKEVPLRLFYNETAVLYPEEEDAAMWTAVRGKFGATWAEFYANLGAWVDAMVSWSADVSPDYEALSRQYARSVLGEVLAEQQETEETGKAGTASRGRDARAPGGGTARECEHVFTSRQWQGTANGSLWMMCPTCEEWCLLLQDLGGHTYVDVDGAPSPSAGAETFVICHGNKDSVNSEWVKKMGKALLARKSGANVLAINWGKAAEADDPEDAGFFQVRRTARRIPDVAEEAVRQFGPKGLNLSPGNTTLIGHSHGGHVIGHMATNFGGVARVVGLDTSRSAVHPNANLHWMNRIRNVAKQVDFYRSSWGMSMVDYDEMYGEWNFAVFREGDFLYRLPIDDFETGPRHRHAYNWFTDSIQGGWDVGFGFEGKGTWEGLCGGKDIAAPGTRKWAGMIRDERVELLSAIRGGRTPWRYQGSVLDKANKGGGSADSMDRLFDALVRSVDVEATAASLPGEVKSGDSVEVLTYNRGDNLTVANEAATVAAIDGQEGPWQTRNGVWLIDLEGLKAKGPGEAWETMDWAALTNAVKKHGLALGDCMKMVAESGNGNRKALEWLATGTRAPMIWAGDAKFANDVFGKDRLLVTEDGNGEKTYREVLLAVGACVELSGKWWHFGMGNKLPGDYVGELYPANNIALKKVRAIPGEVVAAMRRQGGSGEVPATKRSMATRATARSDGWVAIADGETVYVEAATDGAWRIKLDGRASIAVDSEFSVYSFTCDAPVLDGKRTRYDFEEVTVAGTLPDGVDGARYEVQLQVSTIEGTDDYATCILDVRRSAEEDPGEEEDSDASREVQSWDPNEMVGPEGTGTNRALDAGEGYTFTIYFENKSDAEAAAAMVTVEQRLSPQLDWSTFEMLEVGYGNDVDIGLAGKANGTSEAGVGWTNYTVQTEVALDATNGVVTWYLRVVDPEGDEDGWPLDPTAGFLPPNDPETHCGEGHITYRVKVKENAAEGARIDASATIVFDYNEPIPTDPAWWNTVAYRTYAVKFNANGGTGTMANQRIKRDTATKLRANAFKKSGFTFLGWSKSKTGAVAYKNAANVKNLAAAGGSTTLYAQWAKNAYKVAFNANGGTLPKDKTMAAQAMTYGKAAKLRKNVFTRKVCTFMGWATTKTGKVAYANQATVKNLRTDGKTVTLYARWAKTKYAVAFNANGGTGKMANQAMTYGKTAKLTKNAFKRSGWTFLGWATSKTGAVAYKNAAEVKNLRTDGKTTTLYAKWAKNSYKVAFNANGGTGKMTAQAMPYGKAANLRKNAFKRTGYTFAGWAKTKTGAVAYKNAASVKNLRADGGTQTLFAKWTPTTYKVAFNANGGMGTMAVQSIKYDATAKLRANAFTRKGYTFAGWAKTKTGAVAYKNAANVKNLRSDGGTTTLYAVWTENPKAETSSGVPYAWLKENAAEILSANGGDYEAAANAKAANGVNTVWECYVAGLDPTDANAAFTATLSFDGDGKPVVSSAPDLGNERAYTVEGVENLGDAWGPTNAATRFFRVKVGLRGE
jgi:uncharacterized repeat protein (TIGR02543 family)